MSVSPGLLSVKKEGQGESRVGAGDTHPAAWAPSALLGSYGLRVLCYGIKA